GHAELGYRRLLRGALAPLGLHPAALGYVAREGEDLGDGAIRMLPERQEVERVHELGVVRDELHRAGRAPERTPVMRLEDREGLRPHELVERASLERRPVEVIGKAAAV